jgi:hypothetical protein
MRSHFYAAGVAIAAVFLVAAGAGHRFDASQIDVPAKERAAYEAARRILTTSHSGTFIPPEYLFGCATEAECESKGNAYYKRIGVLTNLPTPTPTLARGTMQAWLSTNGFSLDPTHPSAGELRAVYYNHADLGFGRDLHCKSRQVGIRRVDYEETAAQTARVAAAVPRVISLRPGTVYACYVTNFGDTANPLKPNGNEQQAIQKAWNNVDPIATVALEVFKPSVGAAGEVQFFVYDTGGTQTDHHVPVPTVLKGNAIPYAILDNDASDDLTGHKANPGTCMNCHGGNAPDSSGQASPAAATTVVTGSNFLPFDAQLFGYDSTPGSPIGESAQREMMRKLNAFVKASGPVSPSVSAQIDGWYQWCGGVTIGGCAIDDAGHPYTPPSWAAATMMNGTTHSVASSQIKAFYQNVPRKYCRTCHLARESDFDVQQIVGADPANPNDLRYKSKLDPTHATANMPYAERTFFAYWADSLAQSAYNSIWP